MSYNIPLSQPQVIADLSFEDYNKRQLYEISPERNKERAACAKPADSFVYNGKCWEPQQYEGFAIVSMVSENVENEFLTKKLTEIQNELKYNLTPVHGFYLLPTESFHQTVANTLSAERFNEHILNVGREGIYPSLIKSAFNEIAAEKRDTPIRMKMAGLSIFGTAIGILGTFEKVEDYNAITAFRTGFYGNATLAKLDVRMTRPFIGHITLAYVEQNLNKNQKEHLADVVTEINEALAKEDNYFTISATGLRRYHHLAEFIKQDNYPVYQF
jgi:2'-5' RNA ligase